MRILFCGGGTAGHVNPAIAIAEETLSRFPNAEILFIGRDGGKENKSITDAGFNLQTIRISGLKRSLSLGNISIICTALRSVSQAKKIIEDFKPDVILGTGGYVSWPVIFAGQTMKIPTAIHESNISPGLTTRLLAARCTHVFVARNETEKFLPKKAKILVVGNPIRKGFFNITRDQARHKLGIKEDEVLIISFGGSIGAEKINNVIMDVIKNHSSKNPKVRHIHATGQRYYEQIESPFKKEKDGCVVLPYINNMPCVLKAADIVICRCGAMTISEIMAVGVASILIPSPNVSGNHQYLNARYLADREAALLIEEKNLTSDRLTNLLFSLEIDKIDRKNKAKKIKELSTPNAAKIILDELILMKKG